MLEASMRQRAPVYLIPEATLSPTSSASSASRIGAPPSPSPPATGCSDCRPLSQSSYESPYVVRRRLRDPWRRMRKLPAGMAIALSAELEWSGPGASTQHSGDVGSDGQPDIRCSSARAALGSSRRTACAASAEVNLGESTTCSLPAAGSPPPGTMTDIAEPVAEEATTWSPPGRSTASWVVYDIGDTVFQQVMITNYFTLWVAAAGGSASHIAFANSISMALMLGIGPWVGAVSDHLPRRVPLLMVLATGCCLLTFFVGGTLWTGLALFLGANLFFQSGVVIYDALLPAVSTPENRGRVGGFAIGLSNLGAVLGIGLGVLVLRSGGHYETIFKLTAVIFFLLALPCLLWVKEPLRAVTQVAPLTAARGALRDILTTARR